ncbi:MAG: two-component system response regulator [Acidobacteriota bacterium]
MEIESVQSTADILVVDDHPENLELLVNMLKEEGYKARPVPGGLLALKAAQRVPPDLILLDINMPDLDGYEVCRRLKADDRLKDIPVIFLSALGETTDKLRGFWVGAVDYVTKPFELEEVRARVATHLKIRRLQSQLAVYASRLEVYNQRLEQLVEAKVKEISESQMATIFALARLAESRDLETGKHVERTRTFCCYLAQRLRENPEYKQVIDESFVKNIFHASPLHDIGKVGIRDALLLKPGKYTPAEFDEMKKHTLIGAATLEDVWQKYPNNRFLAIGIEIARHHHEKWDGTGYPSRLSGPQIPVSARIMALSDVYDALRSRRVYKPPFSHEESCEIIRRGASRHFDPAVVEAFVEVESEFRLLRDQMD